MHDFSQVIDIYIYMYAVYTTVAIAFLLIISYHSFVFGELVGVHEHTFTFCWVLYVDK